MPEGHKQNVKRTVLLLNSLLICLIAWSVYRGYAAYKLLAQMLGEHPSNIFSYAFKQNLPALLAVTVLACGVLFELFRLKIAVIINLGIPLVALCLVLAGEIKIWPHYDGEAQIGLILVALPLLLICILYGFLYRHDFTRLDT